MQRIYVGCAGWSIPRESAEQFTDPPGSSHLERYARRLCSVEINSSFYRPHRPATYTRWAASVPEDFRFAVKMPREITHTRRLRQTEDLLTDFLSQAEALGDRLGPVLVQLPPSLVFDPEVTASFFDALRARFSGGVACEPRHPSWFQPDAENLLSEMTVARVAADPAVVPQAAQPGGWPGLVYYRLHGSPRLYYSDYDGATLRALTVTLAAASARAETWCIFDNTALGAATGNALNVTESLKSRESPTG